MQIFKGVASGKQSFREHCATKWFLEANPRNISASKISRYTVLVHVHFIPAIYHEIIMQIASYIYMLENRGTGSNVTLPLLSNLLIVKHMEDVPQLIVDR